LLKDKGHNFQCDIVGEGPRNRYLKQLIHKYGLLGRVSLIGAHTEEKLIYHYAQANIFALPCIICKNGDHDGLPNVLIEALAMGVATISTNISAIPELIEDGVTGLLVPQKDAKSLVIAIEKLMNDCVLRKRLIINGREKIEKLFDIKKNVNYIAQLFNNG
jgi:glycosyltransferase involved in cell wall biosynthesis